MKDSQAVTTMISGMQTDIHKLGGVCKEYKPGQVAWNDGKRAKIGNSMSCWGSNITDTRVESEDGEFLPFLKPDNLVEKLGVTKASKINFTKKDGTSVTALDILKNAKDYIGYCGFKGIDTKVTEDHPVCVRVQATFVPVKKGTKRKIVPSHYSYQTVENDDPCNVIITGTPDGIFGQPDRTGVNKLYGHSINDGIVNTHWFEVEPTKFGVGVVQTDSDRESSKPPVSLGFDEMGKTCNTFLVMSFQREQAPKPVTRSAGLSDFGFGYGGGVYRSLGSDYGTTTAARLGMADEIAGTYEQTSADVVRKENTPIMLTIHKYYTTEYEGSNYKIQPSDIAMAIGDMENIYKMCNDSGTIDKLGIMCEEMTPEIMEGIQTKKKVDPVFKQDPYTFSK